MAVTALPYCGMPPGPNDWATAWNTDWRVALALLGLAWAVRWTSHKARFAMGWLVLAVALVSPLCALTVALFAARAFHHLLLLTVAAPLMAVAFLPWGRRLAGSTWLAAVVLALVLWHVPAVYAWAWASHTGYAVLQLALLLPAVGFWAHLWDHVAVRHGPSTAVPWLQPLAHLAVLAAVMGLLGAVLTFAPTPLYAEHGMAPWAFGLSPLEDQQLGGLVMWVPGLLPVALAAGLVLRRAWPAVRLGAAGAAP